MQNKDEEADEIIRRLKYMPPKAEPDLEAWTEIIARKVAKEIDDEIIAELMKEFK